MKREEIEKTDKGILEDFQNRKNLLVSFGGISQGLGIPLFEFFNSISDIDCDKVYLRDFKQAWYQKGVDNQIDSIIKVNEYLGEIIKTKKYEKVCFMGNSMGGYAAILFGTMLNVDKVISFSPQSYINKWNRFRFSDKRWQNQISSIYNYENKKPEYFDLNHYLKKNKPYKTQINIFYSSNHQLDKKHAERLKKRNNITLHSFTDGGHEVVKKLRDSGELKSLIQSSF